MVSNKIDAKFHNSPIAPALSITSTVKFSRRCKYRNANKGRDKNTCVAKPRKITAGLDVALQKKLYSGTMTPVVTNVAFHDLRPQEIIATRPLNIKHIVGLSAKFCPTPPPLPSSEYSEAYRKLERSVNIMAYFSQDKSAAMSCRLPPKMVIRNPSWNPKDENGQEASFIPPALQGLMGAVAATLPVQIPAHAAKSPVDNIAEADRKLITELGQNKDIMFALADKNLGPVVMGREQYIKFCEDHLNTGSLYFKYSANEASPHNREIIIMGARAKLNQIHENVLTKINNSNALQKNKPREIKLAEWITYDLGKKGFGSFYALPKIHKVKLAPRPIVSSLNALCHGLSKWVDAQLRSLFVSVDSHVQDTAAILEDLRDFEFQPGDKIASLDVEALYPSIPNEAGVEALTNVLHAAGHPLVEELITALRFLLASNYFTFNGFLYLQKRGCPMGFPHSPALASLYLFYHENPIVSKHHDLCRFFKRYLDDVLLILRGQAATSYDMFLADLNAIPGMNFTGEKPSTSVDFLDISISIVDNKLVTRTFEKKLNLHLYSAANSSQPNGILKGLIYGLIKMYHNHNTHREDFLAMARKLYRRLVERGHDPETIKLHIADRTASLDADKNAGPDLRTVSNKAHVKKLFFIVPFDENGPSKRELRQILKLKETEEMLGQLYGETFRCVVGYRNPPSLHKLLSFHKL